METPLHSVAARRASRVSAQGAFAQNLSENLTKIHISLCTCVMDIFMYSFIYEFNIYLIS